MIRIKRKKKVGPRQESKADAFVITVEGIGGGRTRYVHLLAKPPITSSELVRKLLRGLRRGKR